jgi:four helix bundle protein
MHRFKELVVWQKSIDLTKEVYRLTNLFPTHEKYGLSSQINRSAVSIPSNIAEGAGRNSNKEFIQFIGVATGSLYELETQLIIAHQIGYIKAEEFHLLSESINEIGNMLFALRKRLEIT